MTARLLDALCLNETGRLNCTSEPWKSGAQSSRTITGSGRRIHIVCKTAAKEIIEGGGSERGRRGRTGNVIMAKTTVCFRAASRKQMDLPSLHG